MSQDARDLLLLILTGIAALGGVTGLWLLALALMDRPRCEWGATPQRDLFDERDIPNPHNLTLILSAIGTRPAYNVEFRARGCSLVGRERRFTRALMAAGSEPVALPLRLPAVGPHAYMEVLWIQLRPWRRRGMRINLRTMEFADWRWQWRSIRRRGWRLCRTDGKWVECGTRAWPEVPAHR